MARRNPRPGTDVQHSEAGRWGIHNIGNGGGVRLLKVSRIKQQNCRGSQLEEVSVNSVSFKAIKPKIYIIKNRFHENSMTMALYQAVIKALRIPF